VDSARERFDVCVVGASFAGVACALAAARAGLRVCVLERKSDPGSRLHTTGIIVREAAEQTTLGQAPARCLRRIERVRLYSPRLHALDLASPGYYFLTTDTPKLMRWLAAQLVDAGVDLRLGQAFRNANRDGDGWQVEGLGRARWLVGADGARSRVAACCGFAAPGAMLFGIEHEYDGAHLDDPDALHCFITRAHAPGYIGWIAQTPTGVQAGLALRQRRGRTAPDIARFLAGVAPRVGLSLDRAPDAVRAGLIPCGGPLARIARPVVILTGDAAGIVSPVTAGGIHSAWAHGEAVGVAIAAHLRGHGTAPEAAAHAAMPRFRLKRLLRFAFDHAQMDWPFDLLLHSTPMRRAAEQIYFHRRR
jgi:flavin-dependent dehydrogenase